MSGLIRPLGFPLSGKLGQCLNLPLPQPLNDWQTLQP